MDSKICIVISWCCILETVQDGDKVSLRGKQDICTIQLVTLLSDPNLSKSPCFKYGVILHIFGMGKVKINLQI